MSTAQRAMTENRSESSIETFLASHPRMIGALFMVVLLLTQVGQGAAAAHSAIPGP